MIPWQTSPIICHSSLLSCSPSFFSFSPHFTHPPPPPRAFISSTVRSPRFPPPAHRPPRLFPPSERQVSSEYELDNSPVPPSAWPRPLPPPRSLIWFPTSVSPRQAEDENLSKIGYMVFQGATIAAGTDTF